MIFNGPALIEPGRTTVASLFKAALRLEKNTLVIFASDNGAAEPNIRTVRAHYEPNHPLRGDKGDLYEGGHRLPFLVRWPGQAPAGLVSDEFIIFSDLVHSSHPAPRGEHYGGVCNLRPRYDECRSTVWHAGIGGRFCDTSRLVRRPWQNTLGGMPE